MKAIHSGSDITPQLTAGTDQINKTYAGANDAVTSSLAARGFGSSGSVGTGLRQVALSKAGAVGSLSSNLEAQQVQTEQQDLGLADSLAFASPGYSSASTTVNPGSSLAGGLAGGLTAYLQQLNQATATGGGAS
jgi:hypothetical protein